MKRPDLLMSLFLGLPLAPRIGADYRSDVATLETGLRGLWQRKPWKES